MAIGSGDDKNFVTERRYSNVSTIQIQQIRSDEPICKKCPEKRSVLFLREHTFLKREPVIMTCPNCLQSVETIVERHNTLKTHLSALSLLPVCFCVLPYCSKMLRDSIHRCPSCGIHLGSCFASVRKALLTCCDRQPEETTNDSLDVLEDSCEARFF